MTTSSGAEAPEIRKPLSRPTPDRFLVLSLVQEVNRMGWNADQKGSNLFDPAGQ